MSDYFTARDVQRLAAYYRVDPWNMPRTILNGIFEDMAKRRQRPKPEQLGKKLTGYAGFLKAKQGS